MAKFSAAQKNINVNEFVIQIFTLDVNELLKFIN